ncbi:uncharacterized protein VTP21DRAFT_9465 [Calcarisporiella thermophila]|uniref:uncharacterized protein n=1 Tax=Calcarisporiella thermophila TaxID=911321 RepID=UPI003742E65F
MRVGYFDSDANPISLSSIFLSTDIPPSGRTEKKNVEDPLIDPSSSRVMNGNSKDEMDITRDFVSKLSTTPLKSPQFQLNNHLMPSPSPYRRLQRLASLSPNSPKVSAEFSARDSQIPDNRPLDNLGANNSFSNSIHSGDSSRSSLFIEKQNWKTTNVFDQPDRVQSPPQSKATLKISNRRDSGQSDGSEDFPPVPIPFSEPTLDSPWRRKSHQSPASIPISSTPQKSSILPYRSSSPSHPLYSALAAALTNAQKSLSKLHEEDAHTQRVVRENLRRATERHMDEEVRWQGLLREMRGMREEIAKSSGELKSLKRRLTDQIQKEEQIDIRLIQAMERVEKLRAEVEEKRIITEESGKQQQHQASRRTLSPLVIVLVLVLFVEIFFLGARSKSVHSTVNV